MGRGREGSREFDAKSSPPMADVAEWRPRVLQPRESGQGSSACVAQFACTGGDVRACSVSARCEHFPPREPGKALIVAGLRRSDVQMNAITCEREATQRSAPHDHRHAYHNRFVLRGGMPSHLRCRLASYSCVCLRSCSLPLYAMHYYGYALHSLPRPGGLELGSIPSRG